MFKFKNFHNVILKFKKVYIKIFCLKKNNLIWPSQICNKINCYKFYIRIWLFENFIIIIIIPHCHYNSIKILKETFLTEINYFSKLI